MDNVNSIYERLGPNGRVDYVINYGSILYNNRIINLSNLIVPIWEQSIFELPADKNRYALINAYYDSDNGYFRFDTVLKSDKFISSTSSYALPNLIPIAQFVLQQSLTSFVVVSYNHYSKMATFSVTDTFSSGDQGFQGPMGYTGTEGHTGLEGLTGLFGDSGITGYQGVTGVGLRGYIGLEGTTGYYPDMDLYYYAKFKSNDDILQDYSPYERDFGWGASGAGITGIYFLPGSMTDTGIEFIPIESSSYALADGVVDNSHTVDYKGGWSSYSRDRYIDFWGYTGMIQAWVRVDTKPLINFTWGVDTLINFTGGVDTFNPLKLTFTDQSLFSPVSWEWTVDGVVSSIIKNPIITFSGAGTYVVKLKATNIMGFSERTKLVTVTV